MLWTQPDGRVETGAMALSVVSISDQSTAPQRVERLADGAEVALVVERSWREVPRCRNREAVRMGPVSEERPLNSTAMQISASRC